MENGFGLYGDGTTNQEFQDNLYFLKSDADGYAVDNYWLATSSDDSQNYAVECEHSENFSYASIIENTDVSKFGLRPVVCIPTSVTGSQDSNNIWIID